MNIIDPVIRVSNLAIGYGGVPVVSDISFSLEAGRSLLVIGHNGAGKSTLLKTLFGLLPQLAGTFSVLGVDGTQVTPAHLVGVGARFLGQGNRSFDALKVAQSRNVLNDLYHFSIERNRGPIRKASIGSLSIGERRIEALRLLEAGGPRCFFLDEPSSGLDVRHVEELLGWVKTRRDGGASFVVVEQQFRNWIGLVDDAIVVRSGSVSFFGAARSLLDESLLGAAFL